MTVISFVLGVFELFMGMVESVMRDLANNSIEQYARERNILVSELPLEHAGLKARCAGSPKQA